MLLNILWIDLKECQKSHQNMWRNDQNGENFQNFTMKTGGKLPHVFYFLTDQINIWQTYTLRCFTGSPVEIYEIQLKFAEK